MSDPLANMAWHALRGRHAGLAEASSDGAALRYAPEVSPFAAFDTPDFAAWRGLAELLGPGGIALIFRDEPIAPPAGWALLLTEIAPQFVAGALPEPPPLDLCELGAPDVADMLALTERTQPGPFGPRTHEMGRYLGLRRDGELIAMAGERMRCEGWVEVSAVCVHPSARGEGLGAALTLAVAQGIRRGGDEATLHVRQGNDPAYRLYERIGFRVRRKLHVGLLQCAGD